MKIRSTRILLLVFATLSLSSCGLKISQIDLQAPHRPVSINTKATSAPDTTLDIPYDAASIGDLISYPPIGEGCQITVLDVHSEAYIFADRQILFPKNDYVFVCVRAKTYNAGPEEMPAHLIQARLIYTNGCEIPVHYIGRSLPDNGYYLNKPIRPGESMTGTLVYEIPKNHGDLLFRFPAQELHDKYDIPFLKIAIPLQQITTRT